MLIMYLQAGEDLHVWGTGSPLRQFIYNVDLGALMVRKVLLPHTVAGDVYLRVTFRAIGQRYFFVFYSY